MDSDLKCKYCGGEIKSDVKKCNKCGEWVVSNKKYFLIILISLMFFLFSYEKNSIINIFLILIIIALSVFLFLNESLYNIKFFGKFLKNYHELITNLTSDIKWITGVFFIGFATLLLGYYNIQIASVQKDISKLTLESSNKLSFNLKVINDGFDDKLLIYNGISNDIQISFKNIGNNDVKLVKSQNDNFSNDIYCIPSASIGSEKLVYDIIGTGDLISNSFVNVNFSTKNISFSDNGIIQIKLNCFNNKNSNLLGTTPITYGNELSFEYESIFLERKNLLFLNTKLEPISPLLSDLTSELQKNENSFKFMSSIYKSDLRQYKYKDLVNKVTFLYKDLDKNEEIFKHLFKQIKKKEEFSYLKDYTSVLMDNKTLDDFYFLGDCINKGFSKCKNNPNYSNLEVYYNYFTPYYSDIENVNYIIIIPSEYKY